MWKAILQLLSSRCPLSLLIAACFQALFITGCCGRGWGSICSAARFESGGVGLQDLILEEKFKAEEEFEVEELVEVEEEVDEVEVD